MELERQERQTTECSSKRCETPLQEKPLTTDESKFIQQHLANERTFLAWVRTIIAILGVGFVTVNLNFELTRGHHPYSHIIIETLGIVTIIVGLIAVVFSAKSYAKKRIGINTSTFQSTSNFVVFLSTGIGILVTLMFAYLLFNF